MLWKEGFASIHERVASCVSRSPLILQQAAPNKALQSKFVPEHASSIHVMKRHVDAVAIAYFYLVVDPPFLTF